MSQPFLLLLQVKSRGVSVIVRYFVFIIGLFLLSVGIDFIVSSSLGATPISSVNYVLSLNLPYTLGATTFAFNVLIIALQFWLIRDQGTRKDCLEILLQIPFSLLFGLFIDLNMPWISKMEPANYAAAFGMLAVGCVIQAIGVVLEMRANVVIMSAEGFVKYYCQRYGCDFGKVKVTFDVTLVFMAVIISLLLSGRIEGVREGTVIAAIATGTIVSLISGFITRWRGRTGRGD